MLNYYYRHYFLQATIMVMAFLLFTFIALTSWSRPVHAAQSRIKDIIDIEGVRDNMLVGYGLVVGLNGTGDSIGNSPFTKQSLIGMLERLGVNIRDNNFKTDNVAAVLVTATLPPFSNQGSRMDVRISTLGDASDLNGGTLLVTPMIGADGEVYAVAQGPVITGGFSAGGDAEGVTKNVPTNGRISNGAIVEREIDFHLNDLRSIRLALRNPDFTTSRRVANSINKYLKSPAAYASDPSTVHLRIPKSYKAGMVSLLTDIEQLRVEPDMEAKIVIDESSGTIVMGQNVRISEVAIAQGNLTIRITETPQVSQPSPFAQTGNTETVPRTDIAINEDTDRKITVVNPGVTLQQLVESLNNLGVGPRDIITILQSIKAAGALQADIEVI
jgi:flagellar P-ring protein precursor FlgI